MGKKDKGGSLKVDFSSVTEGGSGSNKRIKSGTYAATIKKYEVKPSQAGNTMIVLEWELENDDSTKMIDRLTLTEKAAWRVFNLMKAMGKNPQKKMTSIDPSSWVGERVFIDVEDEEYENNNGKTIPTSKVAGYLTEEEAEEVTASHSKKGKKKGKKNKGAVEEVDLADEI